MSIAYGGQKVTFADGSSISSGYTGFKNRIINGAMQINQRGFSGNVTAGATYIYTLDRWRCDFSLNDKISISQNAGSVTPPAGFTKYLGVTSLATTNVGTSDYFLVHQSIEGLNCADLGWGTANAKTVTLSFWVRSSLTGTFGGLILNAGGDMLYPYTYTISSANTWEYKTITIAGPTSGTWATDNSTCIDIRFGLGIGSTYSGGTVGTWSPSNLWPSGVVSVVGTNAATWYVTGVQFEAGSSATSFEYRDYTRELQMCQRYYWQQTAPNPTCYYAVQAGNGTGYYILNIPTPVVMRTVPTIGATTLNGSYSENRSSQSLLAFQSWSLAGNYGYIAGTFYGSAEL